MAYDNRRFVVLPATEINNVNFDEVLETAPDTCRYSVDGSQTFVKYEGDMPPSVDAITSKRQEYTYEEILEILSTPAWVEEQVAP